jgi:beta-carotene/zeaxanthin 4-ketolase
MGILISVAVISIWAIHLVWMLLSLELSIFNPWMYFHILLQGYLFTGLFITAHDAMHGNISKSKTVNTIIGSVSTFLFAGLSYKRLRRNHGLHHKNPASGNDPDYYTKSQNFLLWWGVFMWRYLTIMQIIIMAVAYNLMIHVAGIDPARAILFWIVPAFLGTIQLFLVGVWWPHRLPHQQHMLPHKARTQKKNHLWAMITCYFFGYHFEHHHDPSVPWWELYKAKS